MVVEFSLIFKPPLGSLSASYNRNMQDLVPGYMHVVIQLGSLFF